MKVYYILYDSKTLRKYYKAPILFYSDNFEAVLDKQENQYPKSSLYIHESNTSELKQVGRIKCHNPNCDKYFIIIDNVLSPAFPFCSKICALEDLVALLEAGKEEENEEPDYSSIE